MDHLACSSKIEQRCQCLESSWVKINVDGSVSKNNTKVAIGGVVRNLDEGWLMDFNMVTGMDEIFKIEAGAIVEGMKLAWLRCDIHVIVKIESADSIPNLYSIITASDGAMVARGDLGAELPIEEEEIIRTCRSMGKVVIAATNILESMIVHQTPTRAEVSDIAIAVREGADAVMLSGETAHRNKLLSF
ncbi:pyruvate kinase isozyme G, chloroplastic-like [Gossypium arboreum]|nr:pyruvate kinase isozyme G, chloroplastic-like [Gossypium arboreum]